MKKMKSLMNLVFLLAVALGLWWWNSDQKTVVKPEVKTEVTTPAPTSGEQMMSSGGMSSPASGTDSFPARTTKPEKKQLPPDLEAKYKAALKTGIPDKLTSMIQLFMEQRLEMTPDKGININPTDTPTATAFDLTWRDQGQEYRMHVEIAKVEASYTTEHYIYPYTLDLWVDEKVKIQVVGHMNLSQEQPVYQDVEVVGYEPGEWEKNIKKLTLTN